MPALNDASVGPERTTSLLKGKSGHRSWAVLPKEILNLIVNSYAADVYTAPLPTSLRPLNTYVGMIYTWIRVANAILPFMRVCRHWNISLTDHVIWEKVCLAIDHHGEVASWLRKHSAAGKSGHSIPISRDYNHYRYIRMNACIPCRLMAPSALIGYGPIKHKAKTASTGIIGLCSFHEPDRVCGNCLRSEGLRHEEGSDNYINHNDDPVIFPGLEATCCHCRKEALYHTAAHDGLVLGTLRELALDPDSVDWEIRQTVESVIDFGTVTISSVINTIWEKTWLRRYTKLPEYLDQAVASVRYENREEGYDTDDEISEDEDVMCIQEEAGVRDIAIGEYCRSRILDGNWTSPFDSYTYQVNRCIMPSVAARHPIPYIQRIGEPHPSPHHGNANPPPTPYLAERISFAFTSEMRKVLAPALNNLVRKINLECIRDKVDPSVVAGKMTVEDIFEALRDEGIWWDDYDWAARWEREAKQQRVVVPQQTNDEEESNSSSEGSGQSHQTSPVLSTSTLQTTPSPPPQEGETREKKMPQSDKEPRLLRYVPFIPESMDAMHRHSKDTMRTLWREAAAVLYHCRCSICARAMHSEKPKPAPVVANVAEVVNSNFSDSSALTSDDFDLDYDDIDLQDAIAFDRRLNPGTAVTPEREYAAAGVTLSKKRSSEELEEEEDYEEEEEEEGSSPSPKTKTGEWISRSRRGSPVALKRIKLSEETESVAANAKTTSCEATPPPPSLSPSRKRSSEEMEIGEDIKLGANKKVRSEV